MSPVFRKESSLNAILHAPVLRNQFFSGFIFIIFFSHVLRNPYFSISSFGFVIEIVLRCNVFNEVFSQLNIILLIKHFIL